MRVGDFTAESQRTTELRGGKQLRKMEISRNREGRKRRGRDEIAASSAVQRTPRNDRKAANSGESQVRSLESAVKCPESAVKSLENAVKCREKAGITEKKTPRNDGGGGGFCLTSGGGGANLSAYEGVDIGGRDD